MNSKCKYILGVLIVLATLSFAQSNRKAVFIIVDGVPADVIERLNPPFIKSLSDSGGYTRSFQGGIKGGYSQTPTISAPGYNNLITGVWANKHNVVDNDIAAPNYNYWNLFRLAETRSPRYHTAIFSTWQDNRTKLIGEGLDEAGKINLDHSFDGLELDEINYPHDSARNFIRKIDDVVAKEAARYIMDRGPDLTWVYLEFTDDMGHKFGDGPKMDAAVMHADSLLQMIWEAVDRRQGQFQEDWLMIATTDHGRDAETGKNHGGQSDRERTTWIATNSKNLNARFKQNPAVVDIYPSICNHIGLPIPESVGRELDGVPFIGALDLSDLRAEKKDGKLVLKWTPHLKDQSKVQVFMTPTNNFAKGYEPDKYTKVGEVFIKNGQATFTVNTNAEMLKIALKGPNHWVNVWVE